MDRSAATQIPQTAKDSLEDKLHAAILAKDTKAVSYLLKQGANINFICISGKTLLGIAAETGNTAILQILLDTSDIGNMPSDRDLEHHRPKEKETIYQPTVKLRRRRSGAESTEDSNSQNNSSNNVEKSDHKMSAHDDCHAGRPIANYKTYHKNASLRSNGCNQPGPLASPIDASPTETNSTGNQCSNSANHIHNCGYFVVFHEDIETSVLQSQDDDGSRRTVDENLNSSGGTFSNCALNDVKTPDGMDKLEWDEEEVEGGGNDEEDSLASQYRWYADILDRTSSCLIQPRLHRDLNYTDMYGRCAIHYAAEKGFSEAIRLLINAGCRVDIGDSDNLTPLHLASVRDHPSVARLLLDAGAAVNGKTSDRTSALHYAASRGHTDTVRVLLSAGAKADSIDGSDRTPLVLAVAREHEPVVRLLIEHGAKVNIEEIHGYTPLCEAVWHKAVPIARLLLEAGAKITQSHYLLHYAILHRHVEMARLLIKGGSIVNLRDDHGCPPLITAARVGNCQLVELLLENGASANYPSSITGSTPLHEAVEYLRVSEYHKFEQMFHILRSHGALLNVQGCTVGDTPLYRAILLEKYDAAMLLIRHGTDLRICPDLSHPGYSVLYIAAKRGNFPLCRMLVYAGFDVYGGTPFLQPPYTAQDTDTVTGWLKHMKCNPMSLGDLCCLVVRRQLGEQVHERIATSGLPYRLKKFILLEDCGT